MRKRLLEVHSLAEGADLRSVLSFPATEVGSLPVRRVHQVSPDKPSGMSNKPRKQGAVIVEFKSDTLKLKDHHPHLCLQSLVEALNGAK